jgi:hypothetical protein
MGLDNNNRKIDKLISAYLVKTGTKKVVRTNDFLCILYLLPKAQA